MVNMVLKFGTSGLRGLASDFDRQSCLDYVDAFIATLRGRGETLSKICIGMDLRPSSATIAGWCRDAAVAHGLEVINAGEVPTPALATYALTRHLPALMITASHNPAEHNGIKFYRPDGELTKGDEMGIKVHLGRPGHPVEMAVRPDGPVVRAVADEYAMGFVELFGANAIKGMRLGIDQHSAVGRDVLIAILRALGAECTIVRRSDQFIAVDTEALSAEYCAMARGWLAGGKLDAVVSTDGDGDRPLVFDETGRQVQGDDLGILAARYLGYRRIVTPVSSTSSVEACGWFDAVVRCRIGSPYVIAAMEQELRSGAEAVVGFEANGGFLTGGRQAWRNCYIPALLTRDSVLPILATLAMAHEHRVTLSALCRELPNRAKASGRLTDIDTTKAATWIDGLVKSPATRSRSVPMLAAATRVETIDGARFMLKDGNSVHFRLSGNAPELRCYVETDDKLKSDLALADALGCAQQALAAGLA